MNHIYKIKWSAVLRVWQAVSETARGRGKMSPVHSRRAPAAVFAKSTLAVAAGAAVALAGTPVWAADCSPASGEICVSVGGATPTTYPNDPSADVTVSVTGQSIQAAQAPDNTVNSVTLQNTTSPGDITVDLKGTVVGDPGTGTGVSATQFEGAGNINITQESGSTVGNGGVGTGFEQGGIAAFADAGAINLQQDQGATASRLVAMTNSGPITITQNGAVSESVFASIDETALYPTDAPLVLNQGQSGSAESVELISGAAAPGGSITMTQDGQVTGAGYSGGVSIESYDGADIKFTQGASGQINGSSLNIDAYSPYDDNGNLVGSGDIDVTQGGAITAPTGSGMASSLYSEGGAIELNQNGTIAQDWLQVVRFGPDPTSTKGVTITQGSGATIQVTNALVALDQPYTEPIQAESMELSSDPPAPAPVPAAGPAPGQIGPAVTPGTYTLTATLGGTTTGLGSGVAPYVHYSAAGTTNVTTQTGSTINASDMLVAGGFTVPQNGEDISGGLLTVGNGAAGVTDASFTHNGTLTLSAVTGITPSLTSTGQYVGGTYPALPNGLMVMAPTGAVTFNNAGDITVPHAQAEQTFQGVSLFAGLDSSADGTQNYQQASALSTVNATISGGTFNSDLGAYGLHGVNLNVTGGAIDGGVYLAGGSPDVTTPPAPPSSSTGPSVEAAPASTPANGPVTATLSGGDLSKLYVLDAAGNSSGAVYQQYGLVGDNAMVGRVNSFTGNTLNIDTTLNGSSDSPNTLGSYTATDNTRLTGWYNVNVDPAAPGQLNLTGNLWTDPGDHTLIGAMNVGPTGTLALANGTPAATVGYNVTNSGVIDLTQGNSGGPTGVMTIAGNYVGNNGQLLVKSNWNNPDVQANDKLVIQGGASGATTVGVPKGVISGDVTPNQAPSTVVKNGGWNNPVVVVQGSDDGGAFHGTAETAGAAQAQLASQPLSANGGREYTWTLVAAPAPQPPAPPAPAPQPQIDTQGTSGYVQMAGVNREMGFAQLDTLHQRQGELQTWAWDDCGKFCGEYRKLVDENRRPIPFWGRIAYDNLQQQGKDRFGYRENYGFAQLGADIRVNTDAQNNHQHIGVMGAIGTAHLDFYDKYKTDGAGNLLPAGASTKQGEGDATIASIGGYSTWYRANGSYLDLVGNLSYIHNKYKAANSGDPTQDGFGIGASAEVGRPWGIGQSNWEIEPQAQLMYQYVNLGSFHDSFGRKVDDQSGGTLRGRIGARLAWNAGTKELRTDTFYFTANLLHDITGAKSEATIGTSNSITERYNKTWGELGVGAQLPLSKSTYLFGDLRYSHSIGGFRNTVYRDSGTAREGYSARIGLKHTW